MTEFQSNLQRLIADRHSAEARAFYETLLRYAGSRVQGVWSARYRNVLSPAEIEEVVSEVGLQLVTGALARFRGGSLPELFAFVRTISDRCLGLASRRRLRERDLFNSSEVDSVRDWYATPERPDAQAETVAECPLSAADQAYLMELLEAGSKAEYARRNNQTRAAVTRMVQRIQSRIQVMGEAEQDAVEVWMHRKAGDAIEVQAFSELQAHVV